MVNAIIKEFELYQTSRLEFVESVAALATRTTNLKVLEDGSIL